MIEKIWDFFEKNFGVSAVIVMTIAIAIFYFVINLPKIMDSITYFQSRKIKHINEALGSDWVDDDYKKVLKKNLSILYLFGTLNIRANKKEIKEIIKLSDITEDYFSTVEIYQAIKTLRSDFYNLSLNELKDEVHRLKERKEKIKKFSLALVITLFTFVIFYMNDLLEELNSIYIFDKYLFFIFILPIFMFMNLFRDVFNALKEIESSHKVLKYFINKLEVD